MTSPGHTVRLILTLTLCVATGGCGTPRFKVTSSIPAPMVNALPLSLALRMPKSFVEYVQKDELSQSKLEFDIGPTQADAFRTITTAIFQHVLILGDPLPDDVAQMQAQGVQAVLEPAVDSYVYLQPTNGGSEFYSATIGYKLDLRSPDGQVLGSWIYEGYGSVPARGSNLHQGISRATALAIRDACANIAVHLPQQEIVQSLLKSSTSATNGTTNP